MQKVEGSSPFSRFFPLNQVDSGDWMARCSRPASDEFPMGRRSASRDDLTQTKEMSMSATPPIVDRETWQEQIDELRVREKLHTREGDAIAAARRRLPMVEVDPTTPLVGTAGDVRLIDTFEGRTQLFAS